MAEWEELQVIFAETLAEIPPPLPKQTPITLAPSPSLKSATLSPLPQNTAATPPPLPPRTAATPPPVPKPSAAIAPPIPKTTATKDPTIRFFCWRLNRSVVRILVTTSIFTALADASLTWIRKHSREIQNSFLASEWPLNGPTSTPENAPPSRPYVPPTLPPLKPQKIPEVSAVPAAPQPPTVSPPKPQESAPIPESSVAENQPKPFKGLSLKTEEPMVQPETPKLTQDDQGEEAYQRAIIRQLPDKSFGKDGAKWLMMAAESGHVKAQFLLSQCYYRADGVQRDDLLTVYWLKQAAESGLPTAQRSLGRFYEQGLCGLVKDESIAAAWLRRAEKAE
ncbi:MAG: hypothetical protein OJI67_03800, partial [Prosthecobacter sp.]|nr:hypothetical protein [Prosthecobacter sp.]